MPKVLVNDENLTNIANAIREKNGETTTYKPSEMASAIQNIETGGGKYAPRYISFYRALIPDLTDELSVIDTSNMTIMESMFESSTVGSLDLSFFDTSNVITMKSMFEGCSYLKSLNVSSFDTSNVTNIGGMFDSCSKLVDLDLSSFDLSKVIMLGDAFYGMSKLENLIFGVNLGAGYDKTDSANTASYKINLSKSTSLTHDSLMSVINNVYDIATKGCNVQTLQIGSTNLAKLTEDEIAIATNKGWNVT